MGKCITCNGTGRGAFGGNCNSCRGTGSISSAGAIFQALFILAFVAAGIIFFVLH